MKPIEYVEVLKEVKSLLKDFGFGKSEIKAYSIAILKEIGKDRRTESSRQKPATEKQRKFMEDLGIEFSEGVTKEKASKLIGEKAERVKTKLQILTYRGELPNDERENLLHSKT